MLRVIHLYFLSPTFGVLCATLPSASALYEGVPLLPAVRSPSLRSTLSGLPASWLLSQATTVLRLDRNNGATIHQNRQRAPAAVFREGKVKSLQTFTLQAPDCDSLGMRCLHSLGFFTIFYSPPSSTALSTAGFPSTSHTESFLPGGSPHAVEFRKSARLIVLLTGCTLSAAIRTSAGGGWE